MPKSTKSAAEPKLSDSLITQGLKRLVTDRHVEESGLSPEWALFFELRSGSGFGKNTSYVDAFAINLWPSKKHWRVAYELKASRADFLRELSKPEKRSWGMDVSNEFWYVCYPGVAKPEEIPAGCGLLVASESLDKLRKVVQAPHREARSFDMSEVAALAKRSQEERSLLFRFAGKDLTEEDFTDLMRRREDAHFRQRVSAEAELLLKQKLQSVSSLLAAYAVDMQKVGIEPPGWMLANDLASVEPWDARRWAAQQFIEKPGLDALLENEKSLGYALRQLERAMELVKTAQANTTQLLHKPADPKSAE